MSKKPSAPVGEVCLYGTRSTGAGFIARHNATAKLFGDGEPRPLRTFTDAVYLGLRALREFGVERGIVQVFDSGGGRMAEIEIGANWLTYGRLTWGPAPVYEVSIEELLAAAEAGIVKTA